jgi:predicted CoA-binding protein
MLKRGYDIVPVNLFAKEIDGVKCYERVQAVNPPVDWVLLMTPPAATFEAVRDCAAAGVKLVWMHKGAGTGAVSPEAVEFCHQNGIEVVEGFCPYMFLPESGFFHSIHAFFKKVGGSYPK